MQYPLFERQTLRYEWCSNVRKKNLCKKKTCVEKVFFNNFLLNLFASVSLLFRHQDFPTQRNQYWKNIKRKEGAFFSLYKALMPFFLLNEASTGQEIFSTSNRCHSSVQINLKNGDEILVFVQDSWIVFSHKREKWINQVEVHKQPKEHSFWNFEDFLFLRKRI